ncbi:MAG: UDP-N-acetylmuramate--L-alanine ligase [Bacteroidia bacterium]
MNFNDIKQLYFLGIGGIGMSALARYFKHKGLVVWGYDKTPTDLTKKLQQEGIKVIFEDEIEPIKHLNTENTLIVYTPAIPQNHNQLNWFKQNNFTLKKRSEVLGIISKAFKTIGVAGTHGKTTTSTMIAHILKQSKLNCSAFLGGISTNYNTNFLIDVTTHNNIVVVEADEFDRSFLTLSPFYSIITSTDADHLDIYGNADSFKQSFIDYANKLMPDGTLFIKNNLSIIENIKVNYKTYSLEPNAFAYAKNIRINRDEVQFDLVFGSTIIEKLNLGIPGWHNIENALAASAVCLSLGVSENELRNALASFKGVKRRFEYIIKKHDLIYIDDYAHHPQELKAFISSVKRMYANMPLTVAFQPHLYSRTRDFAEAFAESLSMADEVYLLDIYPARELPIEGVTSEIIYKNITCNKHLCSKQKLVNLIEKQKPKLFCTLGAGDIDTLVEPIKNVLLG